VDGPLPGQREKILIKTETVQNAFHK
jgi:hypothetical protein